MLWQTVINMEVNLHFSVKVRHFLASWATISFSNSALWS